MGRSRVRIDLDRMPEFRQRLEELRRLTVTTGIQQSEGEVGAGPGPGLGDDRGVTVLEKAVWNHEGMGVPRRPFLTHAADTHGDKWHRAAKAAARAVFEGRADARVAFERVGLRMTADIKRTIAAWGSDPVDENSEAWAKIKGHSKPLHWTGQLAMSIRHEVLIDGAGTLLDGDSANHLSGLFAPSRAGGATGGL